MTRIAGRRLTRRRAAGLLRLSERHVRRLYDAFAAEGAARLASRRRGRPSGRRLAAAPRERAGALLRERYADFGPTFAHQKLTEDHALTLSVETLRGWMIAAGLWVPRTHRAPRRSPPRVRRACLGELVQIDGSDDAECCAGTFCTDGSTTPRRVRRCIDDGTGTKRCSKRRRLGEACETASECLTPPVGVQCTALCTAGDVGQPCVANGDCDTKPGNGSCGKQMECFDPSPPPTSTQLGAHLKGADVCWQTNGACSLGQCGVTSVCDPGQVCQVANTGSGDAPVCYTPVNVTPSLFALAQQQGSFEGLIVQGDPACDSPRDCLSTQICFKDCAFELKATTGVSWGAPGIAMPGQGSACTGPGVCLP